MKILYFTVKFGPHYKSWMGMPYALSKAADVKFYGPGFPGCTTTSELRSGKRIDVLKVIKRLYPNDYPDVVIQGDPHMRNLMNYLDNFHKLKCLRAIWLIDVHNAVGKESIYDYLKKENLDLVLKSSDHYNETEWGEKLENRLMETGVEEIYYPFSFDPNLFYDRKLPKIYDVTSIGAMPSSYYPIRRCIYDYFTDEYKKKGFKEVINRVKDGIGFHNSAVRGEDYAKTINQSKIFVTSMASIKMGIIQKFYEVLGSNTLLLSNAPRQGEEMGFIPDVNYAEIKCSWKSHIRGIYMSMKDVKTNEFLEPIKYYLKNPSEAQKISKKGYEMVHSRHTHDIRAKELVSNLYKYCL